MGKKRRSDKHHDIGDPKPGEVGDKRPSKDPGDTPMERIHNRRRGELEVPEPNSHPRNVTYDDGSQTETDGTDEEDEGIDFADPDWEDHFENYHLPE